MGHVVTLAGIGALILMRDLRSGTRIGARAVRAACLGAAAVALAGCNGSEERLCGAAAAQGARGPAAPAAGDRVPRADREYRAVRHRRPCRARAGLPHLDRLRRRRHGQEGRAAVWHRARHLSGAGRPGRRRRSPRTKRRRNTTRPNISGRRRSAKTTSPARPRSRSGNRRPTSRRPRSRTPRPPSGSPRSTSATPRCWPRSTGSSPIISSTSARWLEFRDRPSFRRSCRPIRSTSISR